MKSSKTSERTSSARSTKTVPTVCAIGVFAVLFSATVRAASPARRQNRIGEVAEERAFTTGPSGGRSPTREERLPPHRPDEEREREEGEAGGEPGVFVSRSASTVSRCALRTAM